VLIFSGGEGSHHRELLASMGVKQVEVSFWRLRQKKVSKTKPYLLKDKFADDVTVYLDSGSIAVQKAYASGKMDLAGLRDYYEHYLTFVGWNKDRLAAVTDLWVPAAPMPWERRKWLSDAVGKDRVWVTWDSSMGLPALAELCVEYPHIAVTGASVEAEPTLASRVRTLRFQWGTTFHALATATPDNLRSVDFATATTLSWMSPMMRGETIVWDGTRLVRYRKDRKDQARARYQRVIENAGLDFSKIKADDPAEVTRLALWSYLRMDEHMSLRKGGNNPFEVIQGGLKETVEPPDVDNSDFSADPDFLEDPPEVVGNRLPEVRNVSGRQALAVRPENERRILPSFGLEVKQVIEKDEDGHDVLRNRPLVVSAQSSLRQCDTCFVAATCPMMTPGSECAFHLPVEVKTKAQMKALLSAVLEMQGQRVAFMRFAEETGGGYADPNLSSEMDRLFKYAETLKALEENRESLKISVERSGAPGVMSAIFGDRANMLRELPNGGLNEAQTTRILSGEIES
jgi:hypothetical protein